MALDFGMSDSEIAETPSEVLEEVVYRLHKQHRKILEDHQVRTPPAQTPPKPAEQPVPEEDDYGTLENDLDPTLFRLIKRQGDEIKQLRALVQEVHGTQREQHNESVASTIDRFFNEHADESLLGKGRGQNMKADDPHFIRRSAVVAEAVRLAGPNSNSRQQIAKLAQAYKNLYGQTPKPTASKETDEVQRWREGGLARPTQRKEDEAPGVRKATRSVAAKLSEMAQAAAEANGETEPSDFLQ